MSPEGRRPEGSRRLSEGRRLDAEPEPSGKPLCTVPGWTAGQHYLSKGLQAGHPRRPHNSPRAKPSVTRDRTLLPDTMGSADSGAPPTPPLQHVPSCLPENAWFLFLPPFLPVSQLWTRDTPSHMATQLVQLQAKPAGRKQLCASELQVPIPPRWVPCKSH